MLEDMLENLERTRERFFGQQNPGEIRFDNGYKVVLREENDEKVKISLNKENKEVFDLGRRIVPESVSLRFSKEDVWSYSIKNGELDIPRKKFYNVHDLFDFLHEAGHFISEDNARRAQETEKIYLELASVKNHNSNDPKYLEAVMEAINASDKCEHDAWKFAVQSIKNLDEEYNLGIVRRLGGERGIKKYIDDAWKTHKRFYLFDYYDDAIYSRAEFEKVLQSELKKVA